MKRKTIYAVRLAFTPTGWIGTTYDFPDQILGDNAFSTCDINLAHQFMEWLNSGNQVIKNKHKDLECIVDERGSLTI